MLGIDWKTRGSRTDEIIQALRAIWGENPSSFQGQHFNFGPLKSFPKPVNGNIPIFIGGHSPANARRAARLGDGLMPASSPELALHAWEMMKEECRRIGRDPAGMELNCSADKSCWFGGYEKMAESARRLRDIGVTRITAPSTMFGLEWNPDAISRAMEQVANEVIAKINESHLIAQYQLKFRTRRILYRAGNPGNDAAGAGLRRFARYTIFSPSALPIRRRARARSR